MEPVAYFHSPLETKFGLPRQAGLAVSLRGEVRLVPEFAREEALRGLDGFDYVWLVWEFNLNRGGDSAKLTVRPPRLGGNERVGVFASRSPFRPNPIGLSCVKLETVDVENGILHVLGADLADGTPVLDIKPYVPYADSHPDARGGFTDEREWSTLKVEWAEGAKEALRLDGNDIAALEEILAQDPRPQYQKNPERNYGLMFLGRDVRFRVDDGVLTVLLDKASQD